ncbi:hypothetical protein EYF80_035943 [Liparis tanakae]|uniref:Uncharacterized protein n=1 Tax=Liparis tanakae TaxID=230148 RepID=A0A4Z2GMJ6_9TELE|nr:hypothetical protein EYF80_035943 [Liparis tanakae]
MQDPGLQSAAKRSASLRCPDSQRGSTFPSVPSHSGGTRRGHGAREAGNGNGNVSRFVNAVCSLLSPQLEGRRRVENRV